MKRRLLVFLLMFIMTIGLCAPMNAYAADTKGFYSEDDIVLNPLYDDIRSEEETESLISALNELQTGDFKQSRSTGTTKSSTVYSTTAAAADYIKAQMVAREETITVSVQSSVLPESVFDLFYEAMEYSESCTGQEGDALLSNYDGASASYSIGSDVTSITYYVMYRTTAAEEAKLTTAVNTALSNMKLNGKSDYQKVRLIYDYICDNVDYDYENLDAEESGETVYPLMYTAYAAMCDGKAVCQGYATLFYRMCKDAGLSVRFISGWAGGAHAWNIVKIGDEYYNLDCTWDGQDAESYHNYFLKSEADFTDHWRDEEYDNDAFHKQYPMTLYSWEDYSKLTSAEGLNLENIYERGYYNIDGGTVSNHADGKPKILVFGRPSCMNTQYTISTLSNESFEDIDVVFIDMEKNSASSISDFRDNYGSNEDDIIYAYNTSGNNFWTYVEYLTGDVDSITLPYVVYIDADNKIQYKENGSGISGNAIKQHAMVYVSGEDLVSLSSSSVTLVEGNTHTLDMYVYGMKRNAQFFTWSSSDTSVATVDANGKVTAKAAGTAAITCKINKNISVSCDVTVNASEKTTLSVKNGADITSALQSAVKKYKEIIIPEGSYTCSGVNLSGLDDVTISATGATIKLSGNSNPILFVSNGKIATGITVKGGTWDANGQNVPAMRFYGTTSDIKLSDLTLQNSKNAGIGFKESSDVALTNVTSTGNSGAGVYAQNCTDILIANSQLNKNKDGVHIFGITSTISIKDTNLMNNQEYGIRIYDSAAKVNINRCYPYNNTKSGLSMDNCTGDIAIYKAKAKNNGEYGFEIVNCENVEVNKCTISGSANDGVRICGGVNAVVKGTTSSSNGDAGVYLTNLNKISVKTSKFYKNGGYGLCVDTIAESGLVKEVESYKNGNIGLGYANVSGKMNTQYTKVYENKASGIWGSNCDNLVVNECEIYKNSGFGVNAINCELANVKYTNVHNNKDIGIRYEGCTKIIATKDTSSENKNAGIYTEGCVRVTLNGCTLSKNNGYGVSTKNIKSYVKIVDSTITENTNTGIYLDASKNVTITECIITLNGGHGIYCSGGSDAYVVDTTVTSNTKDGIRANGKNTEMQLSYVTVTENGVNGIVVIDKASITKFKQITASNNGKHGIAVYKNSRLDGISKKIVAKNNGKNQIYVESGATTKFTTQKMNYSKTF